MGAADEDWSGLVVFCAATSWDGNRFPDQHMAERLASYAPVLYVDPPLTALARWRAPDLAGRLHAPPVEVVSRDVVHAFTAARPRTRYRMGKDSTSRKLISRLPDRWIDALVAKSLGWG